ncbi:kinase-like domain-containing protein [Syncephalis plumigaleata]|nr:kinase-like domain-containing protein [Syncephalis plumigaleata]
MNDELQELQTNELEALEAIFMEDFCRVETKTVWKNAPTLPEFRIHLVPISDHLKAFVSLDLYVKFYKNYPNIAPELKLENPRGISGAVVQKIYQELIKKANDLCGSEMIYELATLVQERITLEDTSAEFGLNQMSFYDQMVNRIEATNKKEEKEARARSNQLQRVAHRAEHTENQALARKIEEELARKEQLRTERTQQLTDARQKQAVDPLNLSTAMNLQVKIATFDSIIKLETDDMGPVCFRSVVIGHCIRRGIIDKLWTVQPMVDISSETSSTGTASDVASLLLTMVEVKVDNEYYLSSDGKLLLQHMEKELGRFESCRHSHLMPVYGSKLTRIDRGWRLQVLTSYERGGTLHDLLRRCGTLRIPMAMDYAQQILQALGHLHACNFIHKELNSRAVFMCENVNMEGSIKLGRVSFMRRLLDMHQQHPLSMNYAMEDERLWIPPELQNQPEMYNRKSDVWDFGVLLVEMIWGLDAIKEYSTPIELLNNAIQIPDSLIQLLKRIFQTDPKQRPSIAEILNDAAFKNSQDMKIPMQLLFGNSNSRSHLSTGSDTNYPVAMIYGTSPLDVPVSNLSTVSRYEADFEEIEFLGKGGFGEVVKARNKLDGRFYAIKKVKLDPLDIEENRSIRREITTLSRLHHQHVVRYYTSWIEDDTGVQWDNDSFSDTESETEDDNEEEEDGTSGSDDSFDGLISIKAKTCDIMDDRSSTRSYSGVKFGFDSKPSTTRSSGNTNSSSSQSHHTRGMFAFDTDSHSEEDEDEEETEEDNTNRLSSTRSQDRQYRVLYIQMEYCENKTLRDAIEEGVEDIEAWRLFRQILEGLAYIHNEGMIHRDLKPSNIFLDANGDVKIGDFGLAVLGQAGVDLAGVQTSFEPNDANSLTSGVGTALYVSPEVASGQDTGTRYNHKVDMYSLGIIFFELCYRFSTAMERITVIRKLRLPEIEFPDDFPLTTKCNQADIIKRLLNHSTRDRPSSIQLLQDKALPPKLEDAYLQECIRSIARPDTPYYERLMNVLFSQNADRMTEYTFDVNSGNTALDLLDSLTYAQICDCITAVFRRHGAIALNTPLLIPKTDYFKDKKVVDLMDNSGGLVQLPYDLTVPFARYICRNNITSIKRFVFGRVYRNNIVGGQPRVMREVDFDIVTPRMSDYASDAEVLRVVDEVLDEFPPFQGGRCLFLVNHADVADVIFDYCRIPTEARRDVTAVLGLPGRSVSLAQARAQLTEQYRLPRSALDELALFHIQGEFTSVVKKLRDMLNEAALVRRFDEAADQIKRLIHRAKQMGVQRRLWFAPLLTLNYEYYLHGMIFNAVMERKSGGIIAAGGRYDALVKRFRHPAMIGAKRTHAVGVSLAIQKFVTAMLQYQVERLDKTVAKRPETERQVGPWTAKRCDVYVASFGKGLLAERLAVARDLWQHHISADVQYEDSLSNSGIDYILQECRQQGIGWVVLVRHSRSQDGGRGTSSAHDVVKVKSVLKKVETEVLRSELCAFLTTEMTEQTRLESMTFNFKPRRHDPVNSTYHTTASTVENSSGIKEGHDIDHRNLPSQVNVTVLASTTTQSSRGKPSRQSYRQKQLLTDKAAHHVAQVVGDIARGDIPVLALDLTEAQLKRFSQCNILDMDQFRDVIVKSVTPAQRDYVHTIRKTMLQLHENQHRRMIWLYSFRDEYSLLYRFESTTTLINTGSPTSNTTFQQSNK